MEQLFEKYKNRKPPIDEQIACANNIRDEQIKAKKEKSRSKNKETEREK